MRLSLVISSLNSGGAERVLSILANAWCGRGHDVTILTTHDEGRRPDYPLADGVVLVSVDPGRDGLAKQIAILKRLRRHVKSNRPDAVVSFLNFTNVLALIATRRLGVPVIVAERLDPSVVGIGPLWSALRRVTYRRADLLIAQTPTAARRFAGFAPGRVRVVPNPVVPLEESPGAAASVELAGPTFLAVGRLNPQKGFDVLLRAMVRVRREAPGWRLVILGEGGERPALEAQIRELDLDDAVDLPGRVSNPWPWLKAADAFVLSSHSEGFPNALCEAMLAGLPVVATDCPSGPADIVTDGRDGLLVPVDDAAALARAMLAVASDRDTARRMGARAAEIGDRYALSSVLERWDACFAEVGALPGADGLTQAC